MGAYLGLWRTRVATYSHYGPGVPLVMPARSLAVVIELPPLPSGTRHCVLLWLEHQACWSIWHYSALLTHAELLTFSSDN